MTIDLSEFSGDDARTAAELMRVAPASHFNRVQASTDDVSRLVVRRDPCPFCGVREDIGCRHRPRPK